MIKRFFILLLAIVASVGMSWAAGIPCTAADRGKVLCSDGSIYATVSDATAASKTAAAVIAYVDTENNKGLALALADDGDEMNWATAKTTAAAHTPAVSGGTWTLASKDDWNNMITAAGGYTALRDCFSSVGGTNMLVAEYWTSTEGTYSGTAIGYRFQNGKWTDPYVNDPLHVRACLAFDIYAAPAELPGAFTINANGDKIVFSRGNLQATTTDLGANWTWDFAPNQWSLIGDAVANNAINGNKTVSANGTVDLFGWSTAATYYGINKSWNNDDYTGDFVDWGALMGTEWRTLSRAEFRYIVFDRAQAFNKQGKATVNGVSGYIFLPDAWTLPSGLSFTPSPSDYTTNQYDGANWEAMEVAGAVFLPAAGDREGTDIYMYDYGWYWTSTSTVDDKAYYLYFYEKSRDFVEHNRYDAKSVRLVTEAPIPPYEAAIKLINAIGTVELTAECKAKIDTARTAYDALSTEDKALVTNYTTLTTAEAAFENVMNIWLSGDCDAILWKDTTLTVRKHAGEGNGAMADYNYMSRAPWYSAHWYDPQPSDIVIKSVTIEEGVTHLGDYAFAWMSEMKTATIPSSVTTIPEDAFYWSKAVDDIYLTVADTANLTWALPYSADNQFKPSKATLCHVPADLLTAYQEKFDALNMTFVGDLDPATPLTPEEQQALDAVKGLINAIPSPVVYTPACKDAIDAARAAYDALTPDMLKPLVSNYATLTAAEATYANLKDVVEVVAKINNIPQPVTLKLATRDSIEGARAAYDALTADQKLLVSNYDVLTTAEATMAGLNPGGGMPAGALNGKFTINADGDQIAFSKGNLQATTTDLGANWTWGFAANQWNYLGIAVANSKINGNGTVSENGTVDLFGWSTAATYYGINNSYKAVDYIGDFVDWGPKMGAGWRTLTKDEWNYLIENNTKGRATVNDKNGYIFLPDNWSGPAFTPDPDNFTTNVYSGDDWTAMENAGAVFLPSGPARNGTYALIANDAKYCSSTSLNNDTSYVFTIYYNQSQSACTGTNRAYGCMVRLVTEGGGATPLDSAQAVKDLIEAIPTPVTLEDACVNAIQSARDAYNALTDATKDALDAATVNKLNQAITDYTALIQAGADAVKAKIALLPNPVQESDLKLSVYDKVLDARAAYDALTADQKLLVTNYQTLLDAEAAFDAIGGGGGLPTGALTGAFSVGKSSAICFSQGNLQATTADLGANWTWSFAANQWDFIGNAVANTAIDDIKSVSTNGTVDLFGWSTAATYYGISNNPGAAYYTGDFIDWGTNAISNGGNTANAWHTLAHDEWDYLFNTRTTTSGIRYAKATVNSIPGIILLPDDWSATYYALSDTNDYEVDFNSNVITTSDWTNSLEANGAVFLPAAGERLGADVKEVGSNGHYWSSTFKTDYNAYCVSFNSYDMDASDYINRREGYSVRLVVAAPVNYIAEAQAAVALINAIPDSVTLEDACVNAIQAARAAVTALGENASLIDETDMAKLTDAEQALKDLNQAEADKVVAKINNIPLPVELKLATLDSINSARAAYDALNADQKTLVPAAELQKLLDAEAALEALNPGVPPATPLDSAQAVKDLIDAIPDSIAYPTSGPAIEAALVAYNQLSDAAKGALDTTDVQKMTDAATLYAALDAIAAIENIPDTIIYDPLVKAAIETAREKYDTLIDASKALVSPEVLHKLTNAEEAWAILVAKIEHNVSYIGKAGELKHETVALLKIPDPAPEFNGYEFVRWDVKAGDFLEEGLRIKAVYTPIITTKPVAYDSLMYNGAEQTLITAGVAKEGHIEYRINDGEWKTELPKATFAAAYVVYYKLVREGHADYIADSIVSIIAKAPVVYTAPTAVDSLVYNAANQTLIAAGTTADGTFEYSLDPTLPDSWKTALPQAMGAGTYNVHYRVQGDLNHLDSTAVDPIAVTIAKAALTATADNKNVTYGDAVPAYTITYAGWQGDDDTTALAGQIAYTCAYAPTSNVGEYPITPSGVSAANYDITFVNGKVTVAKATLTVTAENKTVTYGDSIPVYTATYSGWKNGDDASVVDSLAYTCTYAPTSNVGEYTIVPSGATALNYIFVYVNGKVTVNQAALMITAEDKNVIYGDAVPTYTATYSGWKNGDEASVVTGLVYTCAYAPTSDVDEYTITPSGATATNYAITFVNGKVTVGKAALTITADDKNVIYGDAVPTYTATYSGWKNTDTESVVSGLVYTCEYAPTSNVGNYTITPSGATATNYAISFVDGKVTVAQATLTVTAENKTVTYGDAAPAFTATYSGFKNSDDASVVDSLAYTCEYAVTSNVGNYTITPNSAKALNYTFVYVNGTLTVNQAALMITAEDKTVIYGDSVPTYTATYSGWKNSDTESVVTGLVYTCEYAVTSNVGEYTIVPSGATATNYAISYTNGKVTVNQAALMITADDKNVIYGDAVPTYTATYSGWKNSDTESVVSGLVYTCEYAVTSNVGEYTIVPSGATATNYAISFTNGKVTVAKAALTITANDTTMIYGDEHPEFTASYSGWKNADTESVVSGLAYTTPYKPGSPIGTYTINPNSATAQNYAITFVDGTLTVVKAIVSVSDAEAQTAKFADGHANAVVLNQGKLNGVKLQDAVGHVTTAAFSTADVAENLTITLFYELTGDAALLTNYDLQPTSEVFTTEGVIIEPFIPNDDHQPEEGEQVEVEEGIDVYAYGYCDGSGYSLKYHLNSGNPDQYKIDFDDSRFTNVPWTNLLEAGKDGTIDIEIPVDMPTGDYSMTVYFRDSRFEWLESQALKVTFHVNLPETYVQPLFDNTIVLIDTCNCFTDIQWYYREDSSQPWEPIPGATGHYYHADGKLTGEYFVQAKMNGVPTYTCGQDDMNTLYGGGQQAKVSAYPNPVLSTTTVTIENSENNEHKLRVVNLMGIEMLNTTFEGAETIVDMSGYITGNYMITVDGIAVKVLKK